MYRSFKVVAGIVAGAFGVLALSLASMPVRAQAYPNKPVKIVLPFPAGSSSDVFMRLLVERMHERLGQVVLIDPRPGAGAVVATNYLKTQAPDGYTLMMSTSSQTITSAKPNPPFDVRKDMTHIVPTTGGPMVLAVSIAKLPNVKTLKEFIDYAKANPGVVNFGSYGPGSLGHLGVELFNQVAGTKTVHIPYKGSPANVVALANGDSHAALDVMIFLAPQIQAGKARAIALTSSERSPLIPDVPGMVDAGLPDYKAIFWQGISGPAGLSPDVVSRINAVVNASMKDQIVQDWAKKSQTMIIGGTSEALTETVNREVTMWAKLIRDAKIEMD